MMDPADWDRVLVADLAAKRAGLGKADAMRFGRRATTEDDEVAWLQVAVLPMSQANEMVFAATLRRRTLARVRDNRRRDCDCIFNLGNKRCFSIGEGGPPLSARAEVFFTGSRRHGSKSFRAFSGSRLRPRRRRR